MISTYNQTHIGHLPIRVLQHNIVHQFENTSPDFPRLSKSVIQNLGLQNTIKYDVNIDATHGCAVKGPYVDVKSKSIHIQETFLAYVWCISCVMLRYSNNLIEHALHDNHNIQQDDMTVRLLEYAQTIIKEYKDWDKFQLLNPEEYTESHKTEIEKVNAVFIYATNFVLCHEFSHVERQHAHQIEQSNLSDQEKREFELEADKRAIELMIVDTQKTINNASQLGIVIGVCSLLFLRDTVANKIHPDNDVRIANTIDQFQVDENNSLWLIACAALNLWSNVFQKTLIWEERRSFREVFYFVSQQI